MEALIGSVFKDTRYTCVRMLEANDGPFYYESSPRRRDITEGRKGTRLRLIVNVANASPIGTACAPLENAVVDVWHADADGMYSNFGSDVQNVDTRGDLSKPMTVERKGDVLVAEATIGIATMGSMGTKTLFRRGGAQATRCAVCAPSSATRSRGASRSCRPRCPPFT
jgi:hypothetical protein